MFIFTAVVCMKVYNRASSKPHFRVDLGLLKEGEGGGGGRGGGGGGGGGGGVGGFLSFIRISYKNLFIHTMKYQRCEPSALL